MSIALRLSTGWSSQTTLQVSVPETRIRIGSAPDCEWPIQASGVAPYHLEFYWDGQAAWVMPSGGPVSVSGEQVQAWHQVKGHAVVQFGQASVQVASDQRAEAHASGPIEVSDSMMVLDPDDLVEDNPGPMAGEATRVLDPSGSFGAMAKLNAPVAFQDTLEPTATPLDPSPTAVLSKQGSLPPPPKSAPPEGAFLPSGPTRVFDPDQGIVVGSQVSAPVAAPTGFGNTGFDAGSQDSRPKLSTSNQPTDVLPALDGGREEASRFSLPPTRTLVLFAVTALAGLLLILLTFLGGDDTPEETAQSLLQPTEPQEDAEEGSSAESVLTERQAEERERQEREVRLTQRAQSRAQTLRDGFIDELFDGRQELEGEEQQQLSSRVEVELALEAARAFTARDTGRALGIYLYLRDHYERDDYAAFVEIVRERELCQDC